MKTSLVTSCCVVLLLVQISLSAGHRQLNSINDLKQIDFGQSVPRHSLLLLYWFASAIDIDYNDVIRLTFDPNRGDYGTHHYSNFEGVLNQVPWGYRYYTVGNVAQDSDRTFPSYVLNPPAGYTGRNSGRIIIRVQHQSTGLSSEQRIYQVFLTQHDGSKEYDPTHTYEITVNLLRQIRQFSQTGNQLSTLRDIFQSCANEGQLWHIRNTWGSLACLGLFLFIVIQERNLPTYRLQYNQQSKTAESRQYDWSSGATSRNTYSGSFNTSQPHENNEGFFVCLIFLVIAFLLLCASLSPR